MAQTRRHCAFRVSVDRRNTSRSSIDRDLGLREQDTYRREWLNDKRKQNRVLSPNIPNFMVAILSV